jgi:hypothetical protein
VPRREGDPPEFTNRLLRQTWLVWDGAAPAPLLPAPPLQQQSSQAEVFLVHTALHAIVALQARVTSSWHTDMCPFRTAAGEGDRPAGAHLARRQPAVPGLPQGAATCHLTNEQLYRL